MFRGELEALKADNMKLYEKIRYLENFAASGGQGGNKTAPHEIVSSRSLNHKYEALYESEINPWKQFQR